MGGLSKMIDYEVVSLIRPGSKGQMVASGIPSVTTRISYLARLKSSLHQSALDVSCKAYLVVCAVSFYFHSLI